jgi:hypothetical protein
MKSVRRLVPDRGSLIGHSLPFLLAGTAEQFQLHGGMPPKGANLIPAVPPAGEDDACREWAIKYRSSLSLRGYASIEREKVSPALLTPRATSGG